MNQAQLADALGVKPQAVQRTKRIDSIAEVLGVNSQWLLLGVGERYRSPFDRPLPNK